jgi:acyl dehydratase
LVSLNVDYSRVVHGEQRFAHARPIRAGDTLAVTVTLESVKSAGGHDMLTSRSDVATVDGEHVVTAWSTLVVRGEG